MAGAAHGDFHVSHTGVELSKTLRRATSKVVPHMYGTLVHGRRKDEEAM